jgi:hypothetical protein
MPKKATLETGKKRRTRRKSAESSPPRRSAENSAIAADQAWREHAQRQREAARRELFARALGWGTVVALVAAVLTGLLRQWVWVLALEPIAIGFVIGEAAAVPSSVRHRRPPTWSYAYIFGLGCAAYILAHLAFWCAIEGIPPTRSFLEFLEVAPSATAAPLFHSVDLARQISLATGGATALKYWLWAAEGLLMGAAALLAYRGGSVRRLKT